MKRLALYFAAPGQVDVREEEVAAPTGEQLLVRAVMSAISPGTEMLIFRGQAPADLGIDENIPALQGSFQYPFKYGYSSVGQVIDSGPAADPFWRGRHVFSFHPHESLFLADPAELMPLPEGLPVEDAVFLPNMETAVNFVMDGRPMIGERVAVFGLGIVGLLTTALLAAHPLDCLAGWDRFERRRQAARELGMAQTFDPAEGVGPIRSRLGLAGQDGFDLLYELSGAPQALNDAIALAGFAGRVVVGSWYGVKPAQLDLGGRFHRSRLRLVSSQVSSLAPDLSGRWTKERRFAVAWDALRRIRPSRWITQRFAITSAPAAYELLALHPEDSIQVVLTYDQG